jgi:hypothetical protein
MKDEQRANSVARKTIDAVLERHTDFLMSLPGVVGTAVGRCQEKPCIKVFVVKKSSELTRQIPSKLEGFPVVLEETGEIHSLHPK